MTPRANSEDKYWRLELNSGLICVRANKSKMNSCFFSLKASSLITNIGRIRVLVLISLNVERAADYYGYQGRRDENVFQDLQFYKLRLKVKL